MGVGGFPQPGGAHRCLLERGFKEAKKQQLGSRDKYRNLGLISQKTPVIRDGAECSGAEVKEHAFSL